MNQLMEHIDPQKISALETALKASCRPVIVTHMKPDGDAMGSCVAMYHFLYVMGKSPRIVLNDRHPAYLDFLTQDIADISVFKENPKDASKAIEDSDLIICLDFNAFHRTDNLSELLESAKADKILIDHHLSPEKELFSIAFSETEISSASELLYHILLSTSFINGNAASLPRRAAEALMTGMTTDTNNFANSVYPSTLSMASELLAAGVDRDRILQHIYNHFGENRLRLKGHMFKDLMRVTPDGVAYMVLDRATQEEYQVAEGDTEGFVNEPLSIAGVKMSILAKEDTDRIRISIRSKKGTSANRCAKAHFNGGGHENASGGALRGIDIRAVAQYIEEHTHTFMTEEQ